MSLKLLDLFCGAGGAGMGYHRAGFEVVGVDNKPQPRYPFKFHCSDAFAFLEKHGHEFDMIHASPPCQAYTRAAKQWRKGGVAYPDLIAQIRDRLIALGKPYVIENVPGAPLRNPCILNGAQFGMNVRRERLFECSFDLPFVLLPQDRQAVKMGRPVLEGDVIAPVGHFSNVAYAQREMQIPWMGQKELAQAIPPAYTEWIGQRLMEHLCQP